MASRYATLGGFMIDIEGKMLEIGAGDRPIPGFIHNDARDLNDIQVVCDALELKHHVKGRCAGLTANHILEHFSYRNTVDVLENWKALILPGGSIHIEVPNLSWQTRAHAKGEIDDKQVVNYMYGDQDYDGNYHYAAFTESLLREALDEAGFDNIGIQDIGQVLIADAVKK